MVSLTAFLADPTPVPEAWLRWTRKLESGNDRLAVGDRGRSRGAYQIQRRPWEAFGGRRPWNYWAHDAYESRRVASLILAACRRTCVRRGLVPTFKNVRRIYRTGGY